MATAEIGVGTQFQPICSSKKGLFSGEQTDKKVILTEGRSVRFSDLRYERSRKKSS